MVMAAFKWFVAGTLAVPLFHQALLYVLHRIAYTARTPFAMNPTQPFGVPQTFSAAFWGGIWGLVLAMLLARVGERFYFAAAMAFGAVVPTLASLVLMPQFRGTTPDTTATALVTTVLMNLAWGFGTAALTRIMDGATNGETEGVRPGPL
jgi:hypothetical protein